jgi:hypothetical protein
VHDSLFTINLSAVLEHDAFEPDRTFVHGSRQHLAIRTGYPVIEPLKLRQHCVTRRPASILIRLDGGEPVHRRDETVAPLPDQERIELFELIGLENELATPPAGC